MNVNLSEMRSPQVRDAANRGAVAVLPLGQIEEHGPHLPIHTDLFIARRICREAVAFLQGDPPTVLLEAVPYGYSQKALQRWPGTFALPQQLVVETLCHIVYALADMGFRKVIIVSTHGNHDGVTRVAARQIADERGIGPALFFPYAAVSEMIRHQSRAGSAGTCHACEMETSLMLHLAPDLVDMSAAPEGDRLTNPSPYSSTMGFVSTWTIQKSASGVYGDPTVATAEFGRQLFGKMTEETARFIRYYHALKQV